MNNQKRFTCIFKQRGVKNTEIWVDTQTGVNYLFIRQGIAAGLTVMLDQNGKPIVSRDYIQKD